MYFSHIFIMDTDGILALLQQKRSVTITNQIYFYGKALRALGIFNTVDSEKEKEKKCKGFKQPDSSLGEILRNQNSTAIDLNT